MSDDERPRLEEAVARELLDLVLDLLGLALARTLAIVASAEDRRTLVERLALDEQVRAALLLHGLHPEPIEERVQRAVERLQPELRVLGFRVRVVAVAAAMVRLRLDGPHGPEASRAMGLRQQIETAIVEEAPDLEEIVIEGLEDIGVERAALAAR